MRGSTYRRGRAACNLGPWRLRLFEGADTRPERGCVVPVERPGGLLFADVLEREGYARWVAAVTGRSEGRVD